MKYASLPKSLTLGQIGVKCYGSQGKPVVFKTAPYTSLVSVDNSLVPTFKINCPSEGFKLPAADSTNYYVCVRESPTTISEKLYKCFGEKTYNKEKQTCEDL